MEKSNKDNLLNIRVASCVSYLRVAGCVVCWSNCWSRTRRHFSLHASPLTDSVAEECSTAVNSVVSRVPAALDNWCKHTTPLCMCVSWCWKLSTITSVQFLCHIFVHYKIMFDTIKSHSCENCLLYLNLRFFITLRTKKYNKFHLNNPINIIKFIIEM